jgi:hypothetical protein
MKGALPPSSIETFFTVSADWRMSSLPTLVDPVKLILRTAGLDVSSPPTATASPVTILSTPAGMPASSASRPSASADYGVAGAGLTTIVQPAASAAPALRVIIALGKFQGVIAPTTPTGCLSTTMRRPGIGAGITSP